MIAQYPKIESTGSCSPNLERLPTVGTPGFDRSLPEMNHCAPASAVTPPLDVDDEEAHNFTAGLLSRHPASVHQASGLP